MQSTRYALLLTALMLLGGCSFKMPSLGVYKIDIPQGNIVTQEMVDKLQPGMSTRQVRFVMGSPLIIDTFEPGRWDYLRSMESRKQKRSQQRISLFFENDILVRMEGDLAPGGAKTETPATTP
jgi:outer membrane protein assembly factor BamE